MNHGKTKQVFGLWIARTACMRFILSVLILILYQSLVLGSLCESSVSKKSEQFQELENIGISVSELRPEITEIVMSYLAFLFSQLAPRYEQIKKFDSSKTKDHWFKASTSSLTERKSFEAVLQIFEHIQGDAEYYFVGNGFYPSYLMAKALFENTPLFEKIKFVAFSRDLSRKAFASPELFQNYFDSLEIGKNKKSKIVIIDSVSSDPRLAANDHSLIRTANAFRKFLLLRGWSRQESNATIVPLGLPEKAESPGHSIDSLADLMIASKEIDLERDPNRPLFYYNSGILWNQSPFRESYHLHANPYYWSGKYEFLDKNSLPSSPGSMIHHFDIIKPEVLVDNLERFRTPQVKLYQHIISEGLKLKRVMRDQIQKIVDQHRGDS
ncbi:MAG: hypothetical protein ACK5V3_12610 [Bdellovibrionales bacterium]